MKRIPIPSRPLGPLVPKTAALLLVLVQILPLGCRRSPAPPEDPLPTELRQRADRLVEAVAASPSTRENAGERARTLLDWANAYALAGGVLPVNLTLVAGQALAADQGVGEVGDAALLFLDQSVHELQIKRQDPEAMGTVLFASDEPILASSWVTLQQVYRVGSMPMATGGAFLLGRQLLADHGSLQNEDPAGDNYVTLSASNPTARFEPTTFPLTGMHGGFRGAAQMPGFRLAEGRLEPGDRVTLTYGDRSAGSRGFLMQTFSTDRLLLPLYVDLEGEGNFFTPAWPARRVIGRSPVSIHAVAPSILAAGEPFDLHVRIQDRYFNRATGSIPEIEVYLNGEAHSVLPASDRPLRTISDLRLEEPGIYRFTFASGDDALSGSSNPLWVENEPQQRLFWGETHGHTGFAEGQGSPELFYRFAREDARLDFASLSEHDIWLDDAEWRHMQDLVREYTEEGSFVALLGYEWSARRQWGGHHNVFFRTPDHERIGVAQAPLLDQLYERLHACCEPEEVLIIPHAHQAADWTRNDPRLEKLVEIYSMHGTFEWFGNLYLENGFEVGFIGASDDHRARPGYAHGVPRAPLAQFGGLAAVYAPAKTTDAIFDALRGLAAYATSGPRILLDARLNGAPMGTRQDETPERRIVCRVSGTSPIDRIEVVKNGAVLYSQSFLSTPLDARTTVQIGFESSSEVFSGRDNPRPYRIWQGTLDVEGARLLGVEAPGFDNVYLERAAVEPGSENRVSFRTETRGRTDVMLVELAGASRATTFQLQLEPTREYGFAPTLVRPPANLPAEELRFSFAELEAGRLEAELAVGEHVDRVQLQVIDPQAPLDREIEFVDLDEPAAGDYYYVRVSQLDGGRAWSSPFWVGEREESH